MLFKSRRVRAAQRRPVHAGARSLDWWISGPANTRAVGDVDLNALSECLTGWDAQSFSPPVDAHPIKLT
jgi:hypothetical protein